MLVHSCDFFIFDLFETRKIISSLYAYASMVSYTTHGDGFIVFGFLESRLVPMFPIEKHSFISKPDIMQVWL